MPAAGRIGVDVSASRVAPEWIDVNGHMNVAYYVLAFDHAVDDLWTRLGITEDYVRAARRSTFAVECHVTWQRELQENDPYIVTTQIMAYDEKRVHQFQRMYQAEAGYLAATAEWMNLHVDLETRRVRPWPDFVMQALAGFAAEQGGVEQPAELGQRMLVKRPVFRAGDGGNV